MSDVVSVKDFGEEEDEEEGYCAEEMEGYGRAEDRSVESVGLQGLW